MLYDSLPSISTMHQATRTKRKRQRQKSRPQHISREDVDDLLVFGYEAKSFRDDVTAAAVNEGELLIPWRGEKEKAIMVDRYDVRNLLDSRDLFQRAGCHTPSSNFEEDEEELCDAERWADLDSEAEALFDMSEDERERYVEEKRSRRRMETENEQYAYNYDEEHNGGGGAIATGMDTANQYTVPSGVIMPSTKRASEIIERTAKFINASGNPQMEIVIQAKQANNPDFSFLNKDHPLHSYYRHVRLLLQTGLFAYESSGESEGDERNDQPQIPSTTRQTPTVTIPPASAVGMIFPAKGIVEPPHDLKVIIDKTSLFVAKNGPSLEAKVREKNIHDPRFNFLLPWNEFYPYYKMKVDETSKVSEQNLATEDDANDEKVDDRSVGKAANVNNYIKSEHDPVAEGGQNYEEVEKTMISKTAIGVDDVKARRLANARALVGKIKDRSAFSAVEPSVEPYQNSDGWINDVDVPQQQFPEAESLFESSATRDRSSIARSSRSRSPAKRKAPSSCSHSQSRSPQSHSKHSHRKRHSSHHERSRSRSPRARSKHSRKKERHSSHRERSHSRSRSRSRSKHSRKKQRHSSHRERSRSKSHKKRRSSHRKRLSHSRSPSRSRTHSKRYSRSRS